MNNDHPKNHDAIIQELTKDLKPVKPVCWKRMALMWLVPSLMVVILVSISLGTRRNFSEPLTLPSSFWFTMIVLLSATVVSSISVIKLSLPGQEPPKTLKLILAATPILLAVYYLLQVTFHLDSPRFWHQVLGGKSCFLGSMGLSLVPLLFLSWIVARLAPFQTFWTALLTAMSSFFMAAIGIHFHCANDHGCHVAIWHLLPILIGSFAMAYPLQYFFRKWQFRSSKDKPSE